MKTVKFFLLAFALLLVMGPVCASAQGTPENPSDAVPGEILIGFAPDASDAQINAAVAGIGGVVTGKINFPNVRIRKVKLPLSSQSAMDEAISSLKAEPSNQGIILYAEPNIIQRKFADAGILSQSSDPLLSQQWGYYNVGANWLQPPPLTAPVIAVIDTGVDYTHPDLLGKVIKGYDYVNSDTDPMDDEGHGTHVAGIAAAKTNNAYGIAGISWNSKILAIKVLNSQGEGNIFDIAEGIKYAANNASVKVINMSLGGGYSLTEQNAVDYAVNTKLKLLVAAAGNSSSSSPIYPAGFSTTYSGKVIAVAAHDANNCKASFSNYGTWVSITAPGVDILSTVPNWAGTNGFELLSGTSMSSPFVAGAAALVWAKNPTFTNSQVSTLLTTETIPILRDDTCWPADGTIFQKLSLFHAVDTPIYEACSWGDVIGNAVDAETGEPLSGAKVTTKVGTTITGTEYVPYYGEHTYPFDDFTLVEGYGMFHVRSDIPDPATSLTIQKTKYATPVFKNINVSPCGYLNVGVLPEAPNKPLYWLAITWNYGTTPNGYFSLLKMPDASLVYWANMGNLNTASYAKLLWNSWYWVLFGTAEEDLRSFSEVIRIKKTLPGTYKYFVGEIYGTPDTWSALGIRAYIYQYNPGTGTSKLVKTYTPPAGVGTWWYIADISGSRITDVNTITDIQP